MGDRERHGTRSNDRDIKKHNHREESWGKERERRRERDNSHANKSSDIPDRGKKRSADRMSPNPKEEVSSDGPSSKKARTVPSNPANAPRNNQKTGGGPKLDRDGSGGYYQNKRGHGRGK